MTVVENLASTSLTPPLNLHYEVLGTGPKCQRSDATHSVLKDFNINSPRKALREASQFYFQPQGLNLYHIICINYVSHN